MRVEVKEDKRTWNKCATYKRRLYLRDGDASYTYPCFLIMVRGRTSRHRMEACKVMLCPSDTARDGMISFCLGWRLQLSIPSAAPPYMQV